MYSHLPNAELNAVLDMEELSKGIWWSPAQNPRLKKYLAPFNLEKISSTLAISQVNFLVTLLSAW